MRPRSLKIFGRIIPDEHADSAYDDFATPVNAGDRLDAIDEKIFAALETFRLELLGLRQYRHPFRKIHPAGGRDDRRREV